MDKKTQASFYLFLLFWIILNLIQSFFTGISNDEAYYWMYSQHLAWGYFDHPPVIALLINIGYHIFHSELGVRLFPVIVSSLTLILLFLICKPQKKELSLFTLIILSIPLLHVSGFIATPDIPFLFSTALFFFVYRHYSLKEDLPGSVLLGLTMALLMYSKYHGILVILFTILSNLKLITKKSFWLAVGVSLITFAPHLIWQIQNNYPSIKYHLFERSQQEYKLAFTLEYILGQLAVIGPVSGLILLIGAFKLKAKDPFEKALKYTLAGVFVFFLISSLKSKTEAHWTFAATIPLVILSFNYLKNSQKLQRWFTPSATIVIILLLATRVVLMLDTLPFGIKVKSEFYQWRAWAKEIEKKAGNTPVVFMNSFQKASKYTFYTGKPALTLNNFMYRKNQFDLWPIEDSVQGKEVFLIPNYEAGLDTFKNVFGETTHYTFIKEFHSFNKVIIEREEESELIVAPGDSVKFDIRMINKGTYDADFLNKTFTSQISINFYDKGVYSHNYHYPIKTNSIKKGEEFRQEISFLAPEDEGKYYIRISIYTGWLPMGLNSDLIPLEIVESKRN